MKVIKKILKVVAVLLILIFLWWGYCKLTPIDVPENYNYSIKIDNIVYVDQYWFYDNYVIARLDGNKLKKYYYNQPVDLTELKENISPFLVEFKNPEPMKSYEEFCEQLSEEEGNDYTEMGLDSRYNSYVEEYMSNPRYAAVWLIEEKDGTVYEIKRDVIENESFILFSELEKNIYEQINKILDKATMSKTRFY